ncbi:uncharacterized protein FOMMEDRAFT_98279 [Fomitiporia mediterranea MF3/22]|uniref:CHAT domain-containing protein n=1 Tax=Fomitiporia mediterranea (strain MF3/22) TaxID=694068 RepID=R7SH28_FOMME|nr:uncharacterized protein FOMMEDRAFT_98279 [Fomitiporia mediterranea MF3/22]EJC97710.1 hypothetical protein FOMMEDRAFT_98279 [Fomitiporia mediterranea MF3/22]
MERIYTAIPDSLVDIIAETHHSLALKHWKLFEQSGEREELETSNAHNRTALKLRPEGHPDRAELLCDLAVSLWTRYERWGQSEDLEEAIELNRATLELRPEGHPDRSTSLINLASSLSSRYDRDGRTENLEEVIRLERTALELRPEGHPNRSTALNNLAGSLYIRYKQHGRIDDIEEAIELERAALEHHPEGHSNRSASLNNLASFLKARYEQHGRIDDLEEAIGLERAALELRPEGHPDHSLSVVNLANSLHTRYKQRGRAEDLEEAIEVQRFALELLPKGHPKRSKSLMNLASSLSTRFEQYGRMDDLEEAIGLERAALELRPEGHPDRSMSLNNIAGHLTTRYKQQGRVEDLEDALNLHRATLELRPEGHPDRSSSLINLANSLSTRFGQYGRTEDLEEAIELERAALELLPKGYPDRSLSLNNLAGSLFTRFKQHGRTGDLEEAIDLERAAVDLRPEGHPRRSASLLNLVTSLCARMEKRWQAEGSTLVAYKATLSILQHVLTVNPTLHAQHDFLLRNSDHRVLSLDAASYVVEKSQLELAVEILEQGRGLLWSQLRGLRHPLDQLAKTNEDLADRFRNVSAARSCRLDSESGHRSFDELLKLKRQLSCEQEEVIYKIRRISGFENFLEATPFRVLRQVASEGPVIIVNHCKYRCDALIILSWDVLPVVCVPLDDMFYEDSINLCDRLLGARRSSGVASRDYNEKLREAMKMLWDRVVSKVVEKLAEVGIAKGSRIWWCPTSVLSALPFHAAGPFKDEDGNTKYLLDDYVSSYTPTLGALINARSNGNSVEPKLLIVGDTKTLSSTRQEIRNIRNCTGESILERTILLDKKASRRTVIENLQTATWIHFACHGHLGTKPFDSSFKLSDRGLTLLDIIQANVPNAEFAFLSACHTAELSHSGAHDESLHLSAAMQFSGFRSVIGTMWELYDEDGPCVARAVYEHMNECEDGKARYKMAAAGLRKAALELRTRDWIPTERWVNFVHIGA